MSVSPGILRNGEFTAGYLAELCHRMLAAVIGDDHDGRAIRRLTDEAAIHADLIIDPTARPQQKSDFSADRSTANRIKC